jgi:hypothetical protein
VGAFANCLSLETVYINAPQGFHLSHTPDGGFEGCVNLHTVEYYGPVMVYENMFKGCTKLENFVMSDTVETIEKGAFENCTALDSLEITEIVGTIQEGAFRGWTSAQTITVIGFETAPISWSVFNWNDGCNAVVDWDDGDDE